MPSGWYFKIKQIWSRYWKFINSTTSALMANIIPCGNFFLTWLWWGQKHRPAPGDATHSQRQSYVSEGRCTHAKHHKFVRTRNISSHPTTGLSTSCSTVAEKKKRPALDWHTFTHLTNHLHFHYNSIRPSNTCVRRYAGHWQQIPLFRHTALQISFIWLKSTRMSLKEEV